MPENAIKLKISNSVDNGSVRGNRTQSINGFCFSVKRALLTYKEPKNTWYRFDSVLLSSDYRTGIKYQLMLFKINNPSYWCNDDGSLFITTNPINND